MHELGYCEGVLEAVERRAAGRRVTRVGVRIGAVHRVVGAAFEQSFQLVAAGGPAEGATTEVEVVPVQGTCRACRHAFTSLDPAPACPACGALDVTAVGGDEVVLAWVAYAEAAPEGHAEVVPPHSHAEGGA